MRFYAVATQDRESGWWAAQCASLPGCFTQAPSKEALVRRLAEAAGTCLAIRMRRGKASPVQEVALGELYSTGLDVLEIDLAPDQMIRWTADPSLDAYRGDDDPYIFAQDDERPCHALLQLILGYAGSTEKEFYRALGAGTIPLQSPARHGGGQGEGSPLGPGI
ncbi:MAG: type II toxin-antitoxin system HicB family antitoxin [Dehalococcoidia bacterium]|nr:type II toxin-antitoxin system HicB family antitoxin [Dehalococcoidia bacterium]